MMDDQTCAAVCFRAADLIEFVGHAREQAIAWDSAGRVNGYCAIGALGTALDEFNAGSYRWVANTPIIDALRARIPGYVVDWSDASPTDVVVDTIRQLGKDFANGEVTR